GARRRRRSPDHERIWFQLTGYTLRPGVGYPLDEWRAEQTAKIFASGVNAHKEKRVWTEFWIMWRRIAGGLDDACQHEIWNYLRPHLERRLNPSTSRNIAKPKGIQPESLDDSMRIRALDILREAEAPESWRHLLTNIVAMEDADKARAFGDTLPLGLAA